jgi:hypothetical protein
MAVGEFALASLEAVADGRPTSELVVEALRFYRGAREARPPGWLYPRFADDPGASTVEVELSVDPVLWRRFTAEATAQGVSVQQLVSHAVLFYAAELDSRDTKPAT